ncbi:MAG: phage holin family protein [Hyphomicrobiaceae bacterium]
MSSLTRNFSILWRSERLLAEAEWRRSSRQLAILAISGVFALLAIVMFNIAGFYWLAVHYGNAVAALGVGVIDLLIAAVSAVAAQSLTMPRETEMIR